MSVAGSAVHLGERRGLLCGSGRGDRAERQRDDRVEDAPEERCGHERVVGGAAELDQHGDEDGVDHSKAASCDRDHRPGPECDRESGEGIGRRQLGAETPTKRSAASRVR